MIVSERLCLGHPFLKHRAVRESSGGDRVLWGKVHKPLQSVQTNHGSRVPGYGQLEYLVPGLSFESHHHVTFN